MWEIVIESVIKWAVPITCGAILTFLGFAIRWLKKTDKNNTEFTKDIKDIKEKLQEIKKEVRDSQELSVGNDLAIMWSQLKEKTDTVIDQGWCDPASLACIEQLYARYVLLKGNHGMGVIISTVRCLPSSPKTRPKRKTNSLEQTH